MRLFRVLIFAAVGACMAGCADQSSKLVGTWTGSVTIHRAPSGNAALDKDLAKLSQDVSYELQLRKDNTYTEKVGAGGSRANVIEGKWSVRGQVVTITPASVNGEDPAKLKAESEQMMSRLHITLPMPEGTEGPKYLTASSDFTTLSMPSIGATAELKKG